MDGDVLLYDAELFFKIRKSKHLYSNLISRKSNHKCMICDCDRDAIVSHTISKNFLSLIAENDHVICPELDIQNIGKTEAEFVNPHEHNLDFIKKGIHVAGVFKGFCDIHDNDIFESLDNDGIKTERDVFLQIYRTLCFYYFKTHSVEIAEENAFGYQYASNSDFEEMMALSQQFLIFHLYDFIRTCPDLATSPLPIAEKPYILRPYEHGTLYDFVLIYKQLPCYFNFAMENDCTIKLNTKYHHCVFSLFPQKEYTNLIITCHKEAMNLILSHLTSEIHVLNMLESVLLADSQFFISPIEFDSWSIEKKKIIIDDYYFCNERKFLEPYGLSIFDGIRREICSKVPQDIASLELKKIGCVPRREPFELRNQRMTWNSIWTRNKKLEFTGNRNHKNYPHSPFIFRD